LPVLVVCLAARANATTINFDNLKGGPQPGSVEQAAGVTFQTCDLPAEIRVGDMITPSSLVDGIEVETNPDWADSPPNYIIPLRGTALDVLISFANPVTSVQLFTDRYPDEPHNLLRLIALQTTAIPGQYKVLSFVEAYDDELQQKQGSQPLGNAMAVDAAGVPFSVAIFQAVTELEGFDDLTFVPASSSGDANNAAADGTPPSGDSTPANGSSAGGSAPGGNVPTNSDAGASASDPTQTSVNSNSNDVAQAPSGQDRAGSATPANSQASDGSVRPVAPLCPAVSATIFVSLALGLWLTRARPLAPNPVRRPLRGSKF
jgi:hypothetical protein